MDIFKKKAIELVMGLAITEKKDPSVVPFIPSKVSVSGEEKKYFRRKIGGPAHKYSARLSELISRLEAERAANVHSIIVIKDNEVILEASAPGYSVNVAHLAHSMSKTVCAIAIGMLVDDGKLTLDEHIIDFFPELPFSDIRFSEITVEDLLTMRSGVPFGEIGTVTSEDWCESFFSTELAADPGCEFHYNSMNSYIMAKIVTRITGKSVTEFITPRLLSIQLQKLKNIANRTAKHALMVAKERTVDPDSRIICHALKAKKGIPLEIGTRKHKAAAVIPHLFVHPMILLAVSSVIRIGQNACVIERIINT